MEFEEILAKCGNDGRYQYMLLGLLGYIAFVSTLQFYSQNVIGFVPEHWCYHEKLENRSYDEIAQIYAKFDNPACTRLENIEDNGTATISDQACDRWIYKYDFGFRSMNMEYNWVCDSAYKARVGQSFYFFGSVLGSLCFGGLGDSLGRVKATMLANFSCFLGDIFTVFSGRLLTYSFSRFVSGFGTGANGYLLCILLVEYVSPRLRNVGLSTTTGFAFSFSQMASPLLAIWLGQWRLFLTFTTLPALLVGLWYGVVQESAEWLITRNDIDGAILRLRNVAKFNGKTVSEEDFETFRETCEKKYQQTLEEPKPKLRDLLQWPNLRRTYLISISTDFFTITAGTLVSRSFEGLGISPFIVFGLFGLAVLPSGFIQGPMQQVYGRKTTSLSAQVCTALFSISVGLSMMLNWNIYIIISLALVNRFTSTVSNQSIIQLITELIPTSVRSRGLSTCYVAVSIGGFITPYIQHLGLYIRGLPYFVVTLFMLIAAYLCLLLPETRGKKLAISLAEGDQFGQGEGKFDFIKEIRNRRKKEKELNDATDKQADVLENLMPNSKSTKAT